MSNIEFLKIYVERGFYQSLENQCSTLNSLFQCYRQIFSVFLSSTILKSIKTSQLECGKKIELHENFQLSYDFSNTVSLCHCPFLLFSGIRGTYLSVPCLPFPMMNEIFGMLGLIIHFSSDHHPATPESNIRTCFFTRLIFHTKLVT